MPRLVDSAQQGILTRSGPRSSLKVERSGPLPLSLSPNFEATPIDSIEGLLKLLKRRLQISFGFGHRPNSNWNLSGLLGTLDHSIPCHNASWLAHLRFSESHSLSPFGCLHLPLLSLYHFLDPNQLGNGSSAGERPRLCKGLAGPEDRYRKGKEWEKSESHGVTKEPRLLHALAQMEGKYLEGGGTASGGGGFIQDGGGGDS